MVASVQSTPLWAEQPSPREQARIQFERGVKQAEQGDLDGAIAAFEAAYAASPHFSVLFNLAQAYAALGRAVEAASAFERYLALAGDRIPASRRAEVDALLALQQRRIGWLKVLIEPGGAELRVNGQPLPDTGEAIALTAGRYGVTVTHAGFAPFVEALEVAPAATRELRVQLARQATADSAKISSLIGIFCALPGAEILLDGAQAGVTPRAVPLLVSAGSHQVTFRRKGYRFTTERVQLSSGAAAEVHCAPIREKGAQLPTATLTLRTSQPDAEVTVDGEPYHAEPLPVGAHHVQIVRENYRPWSSEVRLQASEVRTLSVVLEPTPQHLREFQARKQLQRNWAVGVGAGSVALAGAAIATVVWNSGRYDDWRDQSRLTDRALEEGAPGALQQNAELRSRASGLRAADDLAYGLAVGAGALAATSVVLWLLSSESAPGARRAAAFPILATW